MNSDWSSSRLVALLPLLAVVILYGPSLSVSYSFFTCKDGRCTEPIPGNVWKVLKFEPELPSSDDSKVRERTGLKYGGRATWVFLAMVYFFVCIGTLVVAFVTMFQLLSHRRVLWMSVAIVLCFVLGFFLYKRPEFHMKIFLALFEKSPTERTIPTDVPGIVGITNFLNALGNAAAFAVLLASCTTLLPSYKRSFPKGLQQLSVRMKYLRGLLYTGTLLLVVAILLKASIYQWSLAFTSRLEADVRVASAFVSSLLSVEGGFYTLLLVAVYVPAAAILQRRAHYLHWLPTNQSERDKVLQENGMTFSFTDSLPRILAILGPILAGPVGEFLRRGL